MTMQKLTYVIVASLLSGCGWRVVPGGRSHVSAAGPRRINDEPKMNLAVGLQTGGRLLQYGFCPLIKPAVTRFETEGRGNIRG